MLKKHNIAMALRRAYLSMHRQTNAQLAPYNITADQYVCMILLQNKDGITQQELVKRATSDPNTIRAILVLLEKRGLVTRDNHPTDGRARIVHITQKGRELLKEVEPALKPVQKKMAEPFNDNEAQNLITNLTSIVEKLTG